MRHGQAAFGTDDYDRLTEIGYTQARLLGGFFAVRQVRCDAIYTGTLLLEAQSDATLMTYA